MSTYVEVIARITLVVKRELHPFRAESRLGVMNRRWLVLFALCCGCAGAPAPDDETQIDGRVYPYLHVDVFTDEPLTGNQLAVFLMPEGLSSEEMQLIAREMMFMTQDLNQKWCPDAEAEVVTCFTCHQGARIPPRDARASGLLLPQD